tara:strand:+ start:5965 stop:6453 length:489 start_codon:yes stop_codon:yes gene_type:complete
VKLNRKNIKIAIVMGSNSDYSVMKMAEKILKNLKIEYDTKIISAHRTPKRMYEFAKSAHKKYKVIIAGAGGAAHLPGMISSLTNLPVIGVPIETKSLKGLDSLLSVVQMPKGIVTATVAINNAMNAGLLAAQIVALLNNEIKKNLERFRVKQTKSIKIKPKK